MGAKSSRNTTQNNRSDGHLLEYFRNTFVRGGGGTNPPNIVSGLTATGGVISDYNTPPGAVYRAHIFTSSGTFSVSALGTFGDTVEYLVVGGGGGGGTGNGGGLGNTPSTSPSQGNNGGTGFTSANYGSGGGGGASAVGNNGTSGSGGNGGIGTASSITGASVTYAGGGGGATYAGGGAQGTGGAGGGGNGSNTGSGSAGTANTGGGGGGSGRDNIGAAGGSGGSGVVIIAYPDTYPALASIGAGLTYDQPTRSGYRVYRFTAGTGTISW